MIDSVIVQIAGSLGVGAFLGALIFIMYRKDRLHTEDCLRQEQEEMRRLLQADQESREANTRALTELTVVIARINGKLSY